MKRVLKITLGVVVALLVVLMVLPFAFKGKLESVVKEEGNKLLNAQFDFAELDISLIRNFPLASVSLKDFWLKGVEEFENDTLVYAGELTAAVNVMSLFGDGGYEVSKVVIDDTRLKAIVLEDGKVNWDVMKSSGDEPTVEESSSEPSAFKVSLKKLSVNDLDVVYDDRQGGMYAALMDFDVTCSGDFGSDNTTVKLKAETPSLSFRSGGVPFLNRATIKADMDVDADLKNMKFTLRDNEFSLNAIRAAIDGWVAMLDEGMDMDLKLNTNEIGFKEILSLIPAIYAKDFDGLKTDGVATLSAYAKGKMVGEDCVPAFDVALNVKNAMFRYPSLPAGVDGINIAATVKNPGGSVDATTIKVNPFSFTLAGNPFSVTADVVTPISDLTFDVAAKGKLDLGKIKDVYPMEDMNLNGLVNADMSLNGRMSYIEKAQYDKVQAQGSVDLSDMKLQLAGVPEVDIKQSTFGFSPQYLQLSKTTINVGSNDITLDSRFENYLGFVFKGSTLKGTLNVNSNKLNLNDFMSADSATNEDAAADESTSQPSDSTAMGTIRVPDNIDFRMQANFKEVLMNKMKFADVNGLLVIKDSKVDMQNLSLNTMGGAVVVNGSYATPAAEQARLNAGFKLSNIGFAQAYTELDMVQQFVPIFSNLKGNFSGSVNVNTLLDDNMSPVMKSLNGNGSLSTKDLSLSDVKFINQVADIVKKPSLKETKVKDLNIDFTIAEGRVTTKPFDIKMGDYTMNLSGSTGLDQTIDYRGKITLPASAGAVSKLGTVDMTIGGTFTSPKVGIDMESLAKQAAKQALTGLGQKLAGSKNSGEAADSTATNTATDKQTKAAQTVGKVLDLFKKKK